MSRTLARLRAATGDPLLVVAQPSTTPDADARVSHSLLTSRPTSSYPARTRKNIEESDGTVIFSLERQLSGGTKLTQDYANKIEKPMLHVYDTRKERIFHPDSFRLEVQALTDFLCSKKIEILNVAGPWESKEPGVYEWTLNILRGFPNLAVSAAASTETQKQAVGGFGTRASKVYAVPVSLYIITQPNDKARLRRLVRIVVNMIVQLLADKMEFERPSISQN
jgi:hypothetical protein